MIKQNTISYPTLTTLYFRWQLLWTEIIHSGQLQPMLGKPDLSRKKERIKITLKKQTLRLCCLFHFFHIENFCLVLFISLILTVIRSKIILDWNFFWKNVFWWWFGPKSLNYSNLVKLLCVNEIIHLLKRKVFFLAWKEVSSQLNKWTQINPSPKNSRDFLQTKSLVSSAYL